VVFGGKCPAAKCVLQKGISPHAMGMTVRITRLKTVGCATVPAKYDRSRTAADAVRQQKVR
jgi:hypothetical protein